MAATSDIGRAMTMGSSATKPLIGLTSVTLNGISAYRLYRVGDTKIYTYITRALVDAISQKAHLGDTLLKYLRNCIQYEDEQEDRGPRLNHNLAQAFVWADTEEGEDFWWELDDQIFELLPVDQRYLPSVIIHEGRVESVTTQEII